MPDKLDRSAGVPLYQQIKARLRAIAIQAQPDQKLFTEDELAKFYAVSRMTVRQAVQELVREGFLYRVRGMGTFLKRPEVKGQVNEIERFFYEWQRQGRNATVDVTRFAEVPASFDVALQLAVKPGEPILAIGRLRRVDGTPLAVDRRYLPLAFGRLLTREDVATRSLWEVVQERLKLPSIWSHNELRAVAAEPEEAALLEVAPGTPLMMRQVVIYTHEDQPFLAGSSAYRGDRFVYAFDVPAGKYHLCLESKPDLRKER